jgi:hypothetical protein
MTKWAEELDNLKAMVDQGISLEKIGLKYNVTKQRMHQIFTKYNLDTPFKNKKSFLKDKPPKLYWLNRMLCIKKIPKIERLALLESLSVPDTCPVLNIPLNYDGYEGKGWTRTDNSPSIDRIDSNKGYEKDNIQIISWRANRIKNDSTPEELRLLADYMDSLQKITCGYNKNML